MPSNVRPVKASPARGAVLGAVRGAARGRDTKRSPPSKAGSSRTPAYQLPSIYERVIVPTCPYVRKGPYERPGLLVRQTLLTKGRKRLPFYGLFADTFIPKHAFLGYYTGNFYDEVVGDEEDEDVENPPPPSHYAANGSGFTVVPPGEGTARGVDPASYPMAMMNEPPLGTVSNATIVEWLKAEDGLPNAELRPNQKIGVVAIHACSNIQAGEEIYFHYGEDYERPFKAYGRKPHNVGNSCGSLNRGDVPLKERPSNYLRSNKVYRAAKNHVYILQ